jgi:hypothetical protein
MRREAMNQAEALRRAMVELGDASAEELAAFIGTKYGVTVRPQFVPVLKATLKDKEILAKWRRKSQEAAQASKPAPVEGHPQTA